MSPVTTAPAQIPNSNQYGYQASKRIFRQTPRTHKSFNYVRHLLMSPDKPYKGMTAKEK
jgi:hypothetical protein